MVPVTTDEPTLTHHNHTKSMVYIGFALSGVRYTDLDQCIMTYMHDYNILQGNFTTLKILHASPTHSLLQTSGSYLSFYYLNSFASFRMLYSWCHTVCSLFRFDFIHFFNFGNSFLN